MSSPFRIFRRHQKVMMVVLVGLSMLSFVVCSSIQDPTNVSGPLLVALLAISIGSIGWLWGLSSKKSTEFGAYGLLLGAVAGLGLLWNFSPPPAIRMVGGDISHEELAVMKSRRGLANEFLVRVMGKIREQHPTAQIRQVQGFGDATDQSMAFAEALRREADRLGIVGSQETVTEFLKLLTFDQSSQESLMTGALLREVVSEIGSSEQAVYAALEDEWRMIQAQRMLDGGDILTPDSYWDAYRKLNVRQDMEIAVLPAADFVDESKEPSESELSEYFAQYRENFPNFTPEGLLEAGRPGFIQPRRIQCVYVEADPRESIYYDQVTVTPEEIEAEYDRRYRRPAETPAMDFPGMEELLQNGPMSPNPFPDGPALPPVPELPFDPEAGTPVPMETENPMPEENGASSAETSSEESASPDTTQETPDSTETNPGATDSETPAGDSTESSCDDPVSELPSSSETPPDPNVPAPSDAPAAEQPAETPTDNATDDVPATADAPPETTGDASQTTDDAAAAPAESATFELSESADPPPPPLAGEPAPEIVFPPPLTDELRAEIAEDLRLQKADAVLQRRLQEFASTLRSDIGRPANLEPDNERHLSTEEALEAARILATEETGDDDDASFDFYLGQTPLLSQTELEDSDDFTFGSAVQTMTDGTGDQMSTALFDTLGRLYDPLLCQTVSQPDPFNESKPLPPEFRYVVWKIADVERYVPESLDDDREGMTKTIRDQVVDAWQLEQARSVVEQRAQQLLAIAEGSTEPFSTLFGETETVEGGGLMIEVLETNDLSWFNIPTATTQSQRRPPPVRSTLPGLPNVDPGDEFMQTVFREMEVGETQMAWNWDRSYMFVVRVTGRDPHLPVEWDASRILFMEEYQNALMFAQFGVPTPMLQLAEGYRQQYFVGGVNLLEKYEVEFMTPVEE